MLLSHHFIFNSYIQGATVKSIKGGKTVISRVLHGGAGDKSGKKFLHMHRME